MKQIFIGERNPVQEAMKIEKDNKIHHVSETVQRVYEKTQARNKQLKSQIDKIHDGIHSLDHGYSLYDSELLRGRLLVAAMLARAMVEEIVNKYRKIRTFPLTTK